MTGFGAPTTPEAILSAIGAAIVADVGVDAVTVFETLADDENLSQFPEFDTFYQVAIKNGNASDSDVTGGGEYLTTIELTVAVNLWIRLGIDVVYSDAEAVKNATYGALPLWRNLIKALHTYFPDGSPSIFGGPMLLQNFDIKPRRANAEWVKMASTFTVPFVLDLVT